MFSSTPSRLPGGNCTLKSGDKLPEAPVKNRVGWGTPKPSMDTEISAASVQFASARTNSSVRVSGGSFKNAPYKVLMSGKKSDLPEGISHVRTTGSGENEPARNHTLSTCRWAQCSPVESISGLTAPGIPKAHCHHSAAQRP